MTEFEKKTRRWFRNHDWRTRDGGCFGEAIFTHKWKDIYVDVNPVIFPNRITISIGDRCSNFTIKELRAFCDLAEKNLVELEKIRKDVPSKE